MAGMNKTCWKLTVLAMLAGAVTAASGMTELETLHVRCGEQQRQIRRLELENAKLRAATTGQTSTAGHEAVSDGIQADTAKSATAGAAGYTVRAGDSIEKIARRHGCSPAKLAANNGLTVESIIRPGQKLKFPDAAAAEAVPAEVPAAAPAARKEAALSYLGGKTHQMRQGETFASLSRKYHISIDALIAANPEAKPTALRPGQWVRLSGGESHSAAAADKPTAPEAEAPAKPVAQKTTAPEAEVPVHPAPGKTAAAAEPAAAPAPAAVAAPPPPSPASAPAESATAAKPGKKTRSVTIDGEMTYGEFAAKHGTDTARLNELNGLDLAKATVLAKGSELYVPAQP